MNTSTNEIPQTGRISIPATTTSFVVSEKFVVSEAAPVTISGIDPRFNDWFGSVVEESSPPKVLQYTTLHRYTMDGRIINNHGDVLSVQTSLSAMYYVMEQLGKERPHKNVWGDIFYIPQQVVNQGHHEFCYHDRAGNLVTEKVPNYRYLFEVNGVSYVLRAVALNLSVGGWGVSAYSVGGATGWLAGTVVFYEDPASV
jgi:hypothetical protein